jgi:hypothetical protein
MKRLLDYPQRGTGYPPPSFSRRWMASNGLQRGSCRRPGEWRQPRNPLDPEESRGSAIADVAPNAGPTLSSRPPPFLARREQEGGGRRGWPGWEGGTPADGEGEVVVVVLEPAPPGPAARRLTDLVLRQHGSSPEFASPALQQHLCGRHLEAGAEEWEAPPVRAGERASTTKGRREMGRVAATGCGGPCSRPRSACAPSEEWSCRGEGGRERRRMELRRPAAAPRAGEACRQGEAGAKIRPCLLLRGAQVHPHELAVELRPPPSWSTSRRAPLPPLLLELVVGPQRRSSSTSCGSGREGWPDPVRVAVRRRLWWCGGGFSGGRRRGAGGRCLCAAARHR